MPSVWLRITLTLTASAGDSESVAIEIGLRKKVVVEFDDWHYSFPHCRWLFHAGSSEHGPKIIQLQYNDPIGSGNSFPEVCRVYPLSSHVTSSSFASNIRSGCLFQPVSQSISQSVNQSIIQANRMICDKPLWGAKLTITRFTRPPLQHPVNYSHFPKWAYHE